MPARPLLVRTKSYEGVPLADYNTDQGSGSHARCSELLAAASPEVRAKEALLNNIARIDDSTLRSMMLARVEYAKVNAEKLSKRASKEKSLAESILFIMESGDVRRGAAKSELGRKLAVENIEAALGRGPLRFAVLTFPFRDMHPFKNVGQLPDAGEAESLIRMWTIGRAVRNLGVDCRVLALRDGSRYPSGWHYPIEGKNLYGDCLRDIVEGLGLDDLLEVRDVEMPGENESKETFEKRVQGHTLMYEEELAKLTAEIESHKEELLSANSTAEFSARLAKLPSQAALNPVCFAMLHGLTPSVTPSEKLGRAARYELAELLTASFNVVEGDAETARRARVWEALQSACKYLSAYRSRSAKNNRLGLDDAASAVPGALRMSIHHKSVDSPQFAVRVGANVHRTTWHGTAEARFSKREKVLVIDTKMAAALWDSHTAVLPELGAAPEDDRQQAWRRYCQQLVNAEQPLLFAEDASLPKNWQDKAVLSQLPNRVKKGPAAKPDRRMKKQSNKKTEAAPTLSASAAPAPASKANNAAPVELAALVTLPEQASTSGYPVPGMQ